MTWTCTKCQNANPDGAEECLRSGCMANRPAGLSEEERAAWEAYCIGYDDNPSERAFPRCDDAPESRRFALRVYRAARAPLEAKVREQAERIGYLKNENSGLHGLVTMRDRRIAELEAANAQCRRQFEAACVREDELKAQIAQQKPATASSYTDELADDVRKAEHVIKRFVETSKPAAPAGLPDVYSEVEVRISGAFVRDVVNEHKPVTTWGPCFTLKNNAGIFALNDEGVDWRRLPPAPSSTVTAHHGTDAQTSREPLKCSHGQGTVSIERGTKMCVACGVIEPAASPSGEVSTENFVAPPGAAAMPNVDALVQYKLEPYGAGFAMVVDEDRINDWVRLPMVRAAAKADIRAAVERERAKWEAVRAKEVEVVRREFDRVAETVTSQKVEDLKAEVERLKGELERAKTGKRCPADGMSDYEAGKLLSAAAEKYPTQSGNAWEAIGTKARELFTPVVAPAQPERKVPRVGDPVWCRRYGSIEKGEVEIAWEDSVFTVNFPGKGQASYNVKSLGETWFTDDPGAKGEG